MALTITPFPDIGLSIPDFTLPAMDGKTYSLKDFGTNTPLVVMFICNHCPYVQAVEDRLIQLGHDLKALNVPVIAICSNDEDTYPEDSFANLKKRWQEKHYSFAYLHDKSQDVAKKFGALCTPDFFVYDKDHKLAYRGRLDDSWKDGNLVKKRELYEAVKQLAEGRPAPQQQAPSMGCSIKWL
jgi:peroxiredoxin